MKNHEETILKKELEQLKNIPLREGSIESMRSRVEAFMASNPDERKVTGIVRGFGGGTQHQNYEEPIQTTLIKKSPYTSHFMKKMSLTVATVFAIVFVSGTGVVSASHQSLPGEFLHGIEKMVENIQFGLTSTPDNKARLQIAFAEERVQEMSELVQSGDYTSDDILLAYQELSDNLGRAARVIEDQKARGYDVSSLAAEITERIENQEKFAQNTFEEVASSVSVQEESLQNELAQQESQNQEQEETVVRQNTFAYNEIANELAQIQAMYTNLTRQKDDYITLLEQERADLQEDLHEVTTSTPETIIIEKPIYIAQNIVEEQSVPVNTTTAITQTSDVHDIAPATVESVAEITYIDSTCPGLNILSPAQGSYVNSSFTIHGVVHPNAPSKYEWTVFEGEAGFLEIKDAHGNSVADKEVIRLGSGWINPTPKQFSITIDDINKVPTTQELFLTFTDNEQRSGFQPRKCNFFVKLSDQAMNKIIEENTATAQPTLSLVDFVSGSGSEALISFYDINHASNLYENQDDTIVARSVFDIRHSPVLIERIDVLIRNEGVHISEYVNDASLFINSQKVQTNNLAGDPQQWHDITINGQSYYRLRFSAINKIVEHATKVDVAFSTPQFTTHQTRSFDLSVEVRGVDTVGLTIYAGEPQNDTTFQAINL